MASLIRKDPKHLSDALLVLEITYAQRAVTRAFEDRRERRNPSDAGALMLDAAVAEAEQYLSACIAERDRRIARGTWNAQAKAPAKTVVTKSPPPKQPPPRPAPARASGAGGRMPAPLPRSTGGQDDDEPESVPIVVFDRGVPRAWRKGDPIY